MSARRCRQRPVGAGHGLSGRSYRGDGPADRAPRRFSPRPGPVWAAVLVELALALLVVIGGHPGLTCGGRECGAAAVRLVADTAVSHDHTQVLAQGQTGQGSGDPTGQFLGIVDRARQWLMWVLTAVVGLIIVFAGLRYAFAGGRVEEIEAAKRTLKAAVTGYLLAVLADSVVAVLRMIAGS